MEKKKFTKTQLKKFEQLNRIARGKLKIANYSDKEGNLYFDFPLINSFGFISRDGKSFGGRMSLRLTLKNFRKVI